MCVGVSQHAEGSSFGFRGKCQNRHWQCTCEPSSAEQPSRDALEQLHGHIDGAKRILSGHGSFPQPSLTAQTYGAVYRPVCVLFSRSNSFLDQFMFIEGAHLYKRGKDQVLETNVLNVWYKSKCLLFFPFKSRYVLLTESNKNSFMFFSFQFHLFSLLYCSFCFCWKRIFYLER